VIHNFVDVQRFSRKPIDAFKKVIAPHGERIILHASNFRKIKRIEDVVRVFANVHEQIPSKLLFVGDGPERPEIESLCRELNLMDQTFCGARQMEDILAIADLFLLTSEYESFGIVLLESMAAGVPVISTNAGGLPEINIPGVTGYLSDIGDVKDMTDHALQILKDDHTLKQFKKQAFKHAGTFDIHNIIPLYEALYNRFL
jgi:N-acetyl-alpha-D-glucosaminyl L-malate synthase BshA